MSFPGIARHIIFLRFSLFLDRGNRHAVAKENRVSNLRGGYHIEESFFDRTTNTDFPDPHITFHGYRDDFTVNQVHCTSTPVVWVTVRADRAAATTWPSAIPPSLGGTR